MPIYEYRCRGCNRKSDVLWRNFSPPDAVECAGCGGNDTTRVISTVALHKSLASKLGDLDPKYDRMLDAADSGNPRADPNYYLSKATPLSEGAPD